jgi:hypothetical protein
VSRFHGLAGTRPWEQQAEESDRNFRTLSHYFTVPKPRSVRAAWAAQCQADGRPVTGRAPGATERAAAHWRWKERAEALDAYEAANARGEFERARRAARKARAARLRALAARLDHALPTLVFEEPRDVLRAVEILHDEERLELADRPEDRATRDETREPLPDLDERLQDAPAPEQRPPGPQKEEIQ